MDISTPKKHRKPLLEIGLLAVFVSVVAGGFLYQSKNNNSQNANAELEQIQSTLTNSLVLPVDYKKVPDFALTDSTGNSVTADLFDDRWSLVFFGYLSCPDICPVSLATVKNATDTLAMSNVKQPQVVFVSVDPARDTPPQLEAYLDYFDEGFVGITGSVDPLSEWVTSMGIMFDRHDDIDKTGYLVDHSSSILLIDPERRIRGVLNAPLEEDTIVIDYGLIVNALSNAFI